MCGGFPLSGDSSSCSFLCFSYFSQLGLFLEFCHPGLGQHLVTAQAWSLPRAWGVCTEEFLFLAQATDRAPHWWLWLGLGPGHVQGEKCLCLLLEGKLEVQVPGYLSSVSSDWYGGKESEGQSQPKAFLKTVSIIEPEEVSSPGDLMKLLFTCNT